MWRPDRVFGPALLLCATLTTACSTGRGVRPLGAGRASVGLSMGGPLVHNLGPPTPLPLASATLRLGATDRVDVDAAAYLPVSRSVGADVGASVLVLRQHRALPALMLGAHVLGLTAVGGPSGSASGPASATGRRRGHRALGSFSARASWHLAARQLGFVGADLLAQAQGPALTPSVSVGWQGLLGAGWSLTAELSYLAAGRNSRALVVHYAGLGGRGSLGLQLAVGYAFALPGRGARQVSQAGRVAPEGR